jgi:gamma-glutamyl-gamma-aminobutyrate hydrolase PuuD
MEISTYLLYPENMKPIIGVNVDVSSSGKPCLASIQCNYYESIQRAGGIPVLLPPMPDGDLDQLLRQLNGLLLIGGLDYTPSKYGEESHETVRLCDPAREEFDFRLVDRTINKTDIPILGICLGAQLLNIALGGSLIQDINSEIPDTDVIHQTEDGWKNGFNKHHVILEPESHIAKIYNAKSLNVPTSHHQAIKKIGHGLTVAAHADDGVVEAVELKGRPFTIGVQWHPERDYEGNKVLFQHFIQAAQSMQPVAHR